MKKFDQKAPLTTYCANARLILECGSVVWSDAANSHLMRLETVRQKLFTWLAARARGTNGLNGMEYRNLQDFFHVHSFAPRRTQFDLIYFRNVFFGKLDSSFLLNCFLIHVPCLQIRETSFFSVPFDRVTTVKTGTLIRLPTRASAFNRQNPTVDFFSDTYRAFRSAVLA